ncbi:MAG: flagellar basal body protein FliL [Spirochaetaceae bacterium]|nr:flagellar basal body protein FliL [Spirochaetaceae bacterium]
MADEDLNIDDEGAIGSSKKSGGAGGLLPSLLKWIAIGVAMIILVVTVVIITMKVVNTNSPVQTATPISQDYVGRREVLDWYTSLGSIRTKTSDAIPASVVVDVVLGYKSQDKITSAEITSRQIEIKDFLRRFFTEKTASELKPQNEDKLRIEIRNTINDDILSTSKIKDVRFLSLDVIEQ